jgi:hypothetical protein
LTGGAGFTAAGAGGASGSAGAAFGGSGGIGGTAGASAQGGGSVAGGGSAGSGGAQPVELSLGKPVTASSEQTGNEATKGNDSSITTKWCASDGTFPQWWRVDLGANHTLHDFTVNWEHPDRTYTYPVETSTNDSVYTLQASVDGVGTVQSDAFPSNVSARYVRIRVTNATPVTYGTVTYPTWACFFDFAVNGY